MKVKPLPSQERLQELFEYSVVTGELMWKKKPTPRTSRIKLGVPIKSISKKYLSVKIDGTDYKQHRIIWKLITGQDPVEQIDHVDLDPLNNAWHNLRPATNRENCCNKLPRKNKTNPLKGVTEWRQGSYVAQICAHGIRQYLGTYPSPEEAHAAYCKAANELHGEYARTQ